MARKTTTSEKKKTVETLTHEEASRKNIPAAEFQSVMRKEDERPTRVAYERGVSGLEKEKQSRAPKIVKPVAVGADPFAHPDAQRRFRVMANVEELERAVDYPWDKWTIFLHPAQRALVERDYSGPARVAGSAGTGKTIVALHRAVY